MNIRHILVNRKTGKIAMPVYDFIHNIVYLHEVKDNKLTSSIIGIYPNNEFLYKEWTHIHE